MKITVKIFENNALISSKVLGDGIYRAGRSEFSDIVLPSDSISRSHLELRVTESSVYMTNMSSSGKVKLNSQPRETGELNDGDELLLGPYKLVIFYGEKEEEKPAEKEVAEPAEGSGGEVVEAEFGKRKTEKAAAPAAVLEEVHSYPSEGSSALRAETVVEMKPVVAKLIFSEGPRKGEEIFLETFEITLGRSKKADIYLDDQKLSRIHAKITRVGMGYRLIDLNSRNGTYVNGMRILEHPLSSFDQIEIGYSKIKFLIHDIIAAEAAKGALVGKGQEQTKSLMLDEGAQELMAQLEKEGLEPVIPPELGKIPFYKKIKLPPQLARLSPRSRILIGAVIGLLVLYLLIPGEKPTVPPAETVQKEAVDTKVPPAMPKEYLDLSPEMQRSIEGHYNSALRAAEQEQFEEAVGHLKKIHESLPYYKQSRELFDQYAKRLKEKQILEAQERAKRDEKQDLAIYLEEGVEYLKEGDFERAAESFNSAIVIDPNNPVAIKGLKAAEYRIRDIDKVPPDRDPEKEKRKLVADLFQQAINAFSNKSYQEAIDTAEKIRKIELQGDTEYLNQAKQIIDRARMLQKEEFEPFLIQAKEKYAEGDYNSSRDLCEEMLKRDAHYDEAKECVLKAKKQLNRLAKEAYTHGYILESMNRIEEAKQYWNRAKNYVRSGDDYYEKVMKKLDYYQ